MNDDNNDDINRIHPELGQCAIFLGQCAITIIFTVFEGLRFYCVMIILKEFRTSSTALPVWL